MLSLNVVKNGGHAATELQFPYTSGKTGKLSACKKPASDWVSTGVTGYANVTSGDENELVQAKEARRTATSRAAQPPTLTRQLLRASGAAAGARAGAQAGRQAAGCKATSTY